MHYLNLNKVLLFPRNYFICLENLKLRWAPTTTEFNIFDEIFYTFLTYQYLQEGAQDFLYVLRY